MEKGKLYAEDVNYWQTSRSSDAAIDEAKKEISKIGGKVLQEGFMDSYGRAAWMLEFSIEENTYRCIWPVLESRTGKGRSAKVQAAVALKHDVKAKCVSSKWLGVKQAFARERLLPDGRTVGDAVDVTMLANVPALFLPAGDDNVIDGEVE